MTPLYRLRESSLRTLRQAGWAGGLGVGCLVSAAIIAFASDAFIAQRRAALTAERAELSRGAGVASSAAGATSLVEFFTRFPQASALPQTLTRIYALADDHGLNVDRTEYRRVDEAATPLQRVSLTLPAQGGFGAVYAWLGEMLGAMPEVGLESVVVRRVDAGADLVDAEIRLVVFVRREP